MVSFKVEGAPARGGRAMVLRMRRRQPSDVDTVGADLFRRGAVRVTERWLFTEVGVFEIRQIEDVRELRHGVSWTAGMSVVFAAAGGAFGTGAGALPGGVLQRVCLAGAMLLPLAAAALAVMHSRPAVQLFALHGDVPRVLASVPSRRDARRIRRALAKARRSAAGSAAAGGGQ
jgi:hypothetical protein